MIRYIVLYFLYSAHKKASDASFDSNVSFFESNVSAAIVDYSRLDRVYDISTVAKPQKQNEKDKRLFIIY